MVTRLDGVDYSFYCSRDYLAMHTPIREPNDIVSSSFANDDHDGSVSEQYGVLDERVSKRKR
jgi:hypothetical protein